MEPYKLYIRTALVVTAAVWATACSDVSFVPEADNLSLQIPNEEQRETFSFDDENTKAKVDVLFVVDNSGSMSEEQAKLGSALSSFITSLGAIDWQLGITTTDVSDGPHGLKGDLVNFEGTTEHILNKNVPDFGLIFANTVKRRELITCDNVTKPCPSSDERPLLATTMAISKRNTSNAGFFRNGADLAVVVLSDEDEGSDGTNATLPSQVMSSVTQAFGPNKTFSVYGILIEPMDSACWNLQQNNSGQYGHHAYQLAELTGGVTGSICDNDYGPTLTSIGNRVRDMVKTITLRYVPDPDRLQLILTPFDSSVTWELEGKIIRFNKPPKKGSQATVVYLPKK